MEIKKILILLLAILGLVSCDKSENTGVMVLSGQIEQGADACDIKVYSLKEESLTDLEDAIVKVKVDGVNYTFAYIGNGVYRSLDIVSHLHDFTPCNVIVTHPDYATCTVDVELPKAPDVIEGSYSYQVNSSYPELECLELTWQNEPGQNYFFELNYLDNDFNQIPFSGPSGLFETHYSGPQTGHHLHVFNNDFRYYGSHQLIIRAVDKLYLAAHYYAGSDELGLLQAGSSNVKGGKGLITASSKKEILLQINP